MSVLAIVPARAGSKGIPNKNFAPLAGISPLRRALDCAATARCDEVVISSDALVAEHLPPFHDGEPFSILPRPAELAQDDTPMVDVVAHVLREIPGPASKRDPPLLETAELVIRGHEWLQDRDGPTPFRDFQPLAALNPP